MLVWSCVRWMETQENENVCVWRATLQETVTLQWVSMYQFHLFQSQPSTATGNTIPHCLPVTSGGIATIFNQVCLHIASRDIFRKHHLSFLLQEQTSRNTEVAVIDLLIGSRLIHICVCDHVLLVALIIKTRHRESCSSTNGNQLIISARWYRGIWDCYMENVAARELILIRLNTRCVACKRDVFSLHWKLFTLKWNQSKMLLHIAGIVFLFNVVNSGCFFRFILSMLEDSFLK